MAPSTLLLFLLWTPPSAAQTSAGSLLQSVAPAISSGSAVFIGAVEDATGRSEQAARALRAELQIGALASGRGWTLHEPAPEGPHFVLAGRIVDDGGGLRAYLFVRRSTGTEVLAGASAALAVETPAARPSPPSEPAPTAAAPADVRRRWGAFGGALRRFDSNRISALAGAVLRPPEGPWELVAEAGRFSMGTRRERREGTNTFYSHHEIQATFLRLRPGLRKTVGRLPWCGFDRCPRVSVDGGAGLALYQLEARTTTRIQSLLGGTVGSGPDREGTFRRLVPFAAAGLTLELNKRLELGLNGEFVLAGDPVNENPYGGPGLGARLSVFFP